MDVTNTKYQYQISGQHIKFVPFINRMSCFVHTKVQNSVGVGGTARRGGSSPRDIRNILTLFLIDQQHLNTQTYMYVSSFPTPQSK